MLYSAGMNSKLNTPDEIWFGRKEYSIWTDWKVNGWLFAATIISAACDIVFRTKVSQWALSWRVIAAMLPFLAILFWVRSLVRWVGGMDELHRRITLAAICFTTGATFFFVLAWHRLDKAGLFQAIFANGGSAESNWDIVTLGHVFLLLTFFYFLGYRIFNRRYQ
jgi:hypothetical protein